MILVFSALIEYAFVNSMTRMEMERRRRRRSDDGATWRHDDDHDSPPDSNPDSPRKDMVINQRNSVNATEIVRTFSNHQFPFTCSAPIARSVAQKTKFALRANDESPYGIEVTDLAIGACRKRNGPIATRQAKSHAK